MQQGRKELGERQTLGMGQRLGLGERRLALPLGLVRIAQAPQGRGRYCEACHLRGQAVAERLGPLRCRIDAGEALREVRPGGGVFAQKECGGPEYLMGQ